MNAPWIHAYSHTTYTQAVNQTRTRTYSHVDILMHSFIHTLLIPSYQHFFIHVCVEENLNLWKHIFWRYKLWIFMWKQRTSYLTYMHTLRKFVCHTNSRFACMLEGSSLEVKNILAFYQKELQSSIAMILCL